MRDVAQSCPGIAEVPLIYKAQDRREAPTPGHPSRRHEPKAVRQNKSINSKKVLLYAASRHVTPYDEILLWNFGAEKI